MTVTDVMTAGIVTVSPGDAYDGSRQETAAIIDVRPINDFSTRHAPDAICIPLADFVRRASEIPTDRVVCVMCQSGSLSSQAVRRARALGLVNVVDVSGGLDAWRKIGLPTVAPRRTVTTETRTQALTGALILASTVAGLIISKDFLAVPALVGLALMLSSASGANR